MPLLSIIIPVYNVENYLEECLNSILNQYFNGYEVIMVNNASKDRSGDICEIYQSKYNNFKTIHLKKNILPAGARNVGLKSAIGEYVHFCDSDDYYIKNTFKCISHKLQESYPNVLLGKFICKPEKGAYVCNDVQFNSKELKQNNNINLIKHILDTPNFLCTPWRFIVERKFLDRNNIAFPEGCHSEDEEWGIKVLCKLKNYVVLEEPFYCYRPRAVGSITATKDFIKSKSKFIVAFNLLRFLDKEQYEDIKKDLLYARIDMLLGSFITRCDTFTAEQINELADIINENQYLMPLINEIDNRRDLYNTIKEYGSYKGLSYYCEQVVKETLDVVQGKKEKNIYIFPTGNNGESTARILQKFEYKVKGFLDNGPSKNNTIINGIPVRLPNMLNSISKEELEKLFIVVSVQQVETANKIKNQLRSYGLDDSKFTSRIY